MCGICGIIDYRNRVNLDENRIHAMCNKMRHRGPDDEGIYVNKNNLSIGLGHRRLSIIDLSQEAHQPMCNEDRRIWIIFNGEIYNYKELRNELDNRGHIFKSNSDTETVIHLYEEYGEECVKFLRGMFAFAIWDEKKQILLLARDRVGKKPLLYSYVNEVFCFASEFTAFLESGLIEKDINYHAIHYYLTFGYIPAPLTIYNNVFKLPPAHRLILKEKKITLEQYWRLDYSNKINISEADAQEEILKLLRETVRIRLYSDVPLGVFLSGGIDSSTIVALMSQLSGARVKTFSIGFDDKDYSELDYARNIAKRFDTDHHEFIVRPDASKILPLLIEHYGEPYADSSCIPTYYVSQQTKQYVTVALNGDGGDELFAGYDRYLAMLFAEKIPYSFRVLCSRLVNILPNSVGSRNKLMRIKRFINALTLPLHKRYIGWVGIYDEKLQGIMYSRDFSHLTSEFDSTAIIRPFLIQDGKTSLVDSLLHTDVMTYLPNDLLVKVDITSMANSLEARSPFLDHKLMEFVASLPAEYKIKRAIKKYILKKTIKDLIPRENIHRKKMGFGVPVGRWFRNELRSLLIDTLLSQKNLDRGYFKADSIKTMVKQHLKEKADYSYQLWSLLMLELWHRRFID